MDFHPEEYCRPGNVPEALDLLSKYREKARIIAGGTDLLVQKPSGINCLIDIADLGLAYIRETDGIIRIGAATKVQALENSQVLAQGPLVVLSEAARAMAGPTVRNMATVGGNICNASPAADLPIALMVLNAFIVIVGPGGSRGLPVGEFFVDVNRTRLKDDEFVVEIEIPESALRAGTCFLKLRRHQTAVDLAVVNTAVSVTTGDSFCSDVKIAVGAVAKTPIYAVQAQKSLIGKSLDSEAIRNAAKIASDESQPIDDIRASARYRRRMVEVLVRRALETCGRRCQPWQN
jgi:carbon-monoxide dehydrogenase medium subunit